MKTIIIKIIQWACSLNKHRTCKSPEYELQIKPCKKNTDWHDLYLAGRCTQCGEIIKAYPLYYYTHLSYDKAWKFAYDPVFLPKHIEILFSDW
jgi:hypothetical protein